MKIINEEIIGELKYLVVEFDQAELLAGHIGVISQGAVRRYFEGKNPDLKVKKCGGLKLDSQRDIVTMRFGVVNRGGVITTVSDEVSEVKLLNPGYDELVESNLKLVRESNKVQDLFHEVRDRYDALVIAVGKEAQKFSAMLVENEELKKQADSAFAECPHCVENEKLKVANARWEKKFDDLTRPVNIDLEQDVDLSPEDKPFNAADFLDKEVIELGEDAADLISGDENKDTVDLEPEGEPDDGTPDCRSDGTVPLSEAERQDIVPTKEITQEEAKKIMEENEKYPGQYQV